MTSPCPSFCATSKRPCSELFGRFIKSKHRSSSVFFSISRTFASESSMVTCRVSVALGDQRTRYHSVWCVCGHHPARSRRAVLNVTPSRSHGTASHRLQVSSSPSTHPPSTTTWDAQLDKLHSVQRPCTLRGLSSPEPHNLRAGAGALPFPSPATTAVTECSPEPDVFLFAQATRSSARIKLRRWPTPSVRARQIVVRPALAQG